MSIVVIPLKMHSMMTKNYIYIIFDRHQKEAVIIDPAGDLDIIEDVFIQYGLSLSAILVTHTHPDHVALIPSLVRKYGCRVWVSGKEQLTPFLSSYKKLALITTEAPFNAAQLAITPISTPGHTFGSICYLIGDNLFSGDTLFIEGCGMCFGSGSDPKLLFSSLNKLKKVIKPSTKIFPAHSYGHEPGKLFGFLLDNNFYLQFKEEQEEMFVAFRMRKRQASLFDFQ